MKKVISTPNAPQARGPYSQAIEANGTLYVCGQIPVNPATKEIPTTIEEQTKQCLDNIGAILKSAGYSYSDVVKSTVLLTNMDDFASVNIVYASYYVENPPVRSCYQVAKLPLGVMIEIETIAIK